MAGIYIAAAHKSSGKTTLSIGLSAAFYAQAKTVQTFKKGPDYIDPLWLSRASGRPCYNLDFYVDSLSEIKNTYCRQSANNDINIVEGNKGLYDGLSLDGTDSNAALANLLELPVVLVIDCEGVTRGIAPLLSGYKDFSAPKVKFSGVILNKVGGSRHEQKLISALAEYTDFKILGSIRKSADLIIDERHLGLMPSNENKDSQDIINTLASVVQDSVDLSQISNMSKGSDYVNCSGDLDLDIKSIKPDPLDNSFDITIGVARDAAFGFYYQSDLDKFKQLGAKIKFFSILKDKKLPKVGGVFLGGGFPETHMHEISANTSMLKDLAQKISQGLPVYAECGGMMILTKKIVWDSDSAPMANVIQADCVMSKRPYGRGYVNLIPTPEHPWVNELDKKNVEIKAHEFHYSKLDNFTANYKFSYTVTRGAGIKNQKDGIAYKNLLANYSHFKDSENYSWIEDFLRFCQKNNLDQV